MRDISAKHARYYRTSAKRNTVGAKVCSLVAMIATLCGVAWHPVLALVPPLVVLAAIHLVMATSDHGRAEIAHRWSQGIFDRR